MYDRSQNASTVVPNQINRIQLHLYTQRHMFYQTKLKEGERGRHLTNERLSFSYKKYTWEIQLWSHTQSLLWVEAFASVLGMLQKQVTRLEAFSVEALESLHFLHEVASSVQVEVTEGAWNGWKQEVNIVCEGLCWDVLTTERLIIAFKIFKCLLDVDPNLFFLSHSTRL